MSGTPGGTAKLMGAKRHVEFWVQEFLKEYGRLLDRQVDERFHNKFWLVSSNLSAEAIVSDYDFLIILRPSTTNRIQITCTPYPAQAQLFMDDVQRVIPKNTEIASPEEVWRLRKHAFFGNEADGIVYSGFGLHSSTPIFVRFGPSRFGVLRNSMWIFAYETNAHIRFAVSNSLPCALAGAVLALALRRAPKESAARTLQVDMFSVFAESEEFRLYQAEPALKPLADRIAAGKVDPNYRPWMQAIDMKALREGLVRNKLSTDYIDTFIGAASLGVQHGTLYWRYSSPSGAMIQWCLLNILWLLLLSFVGRWVTLDQWFTFLSAAVLATNVWTFSKAPTSAPVLWWLLPALLWLCAHCVLIRLKNQRVTSLGPAKTMERVARD